MPKVTQYHGAIILMGVSGAGKSSVGRLLAAELQCSFIEGDDFHSRENIAKMRAGDALNDDDRWPWLERLGTALRVAVGTSGTVVASCSALKRIYRERLVTAINAPTAFILLNAPQSQLLERMTNRSGHFMPVTLLESQLNSLEQPAPEERALILNVAEPAELTRSIRDWLARI